MNWTKKQINSMHEHFEGASSGNSFSSRKKTGVANRQSHVNKLKKKENKSLKDLEMARESCDPMQVIQCLQATSRMYIDAENPRAEKYVHELVDICERWYGENTLEVAEALDLLVCCYINERDREKVISALERRANVLEKNGEYDLLVEVLEDLEGHYFEHEQFGQAQSVELRLLAVLEKKYGSKSDKFESEVELYLEKLRAYGMDAEAEEFSQL